MSEEQKTLADLVQKTPNGVPFIEITDLLTEEELKNVWRTIDSFEIAYMPRDPGETGASAPVGQNLSQLKQNYSIPLGMIYGSPEVQALCPLTNSLVPKFDGLRVPLSEADPAFRQLGVIPHLNIRLNYYGDGDRYENHIDEGHITAIFFVARDETRFEGGDVILEDECEVKFENNKLLVMPSYAVHRVTPVEVRREDELSGNGRWSLTMMV